jgi:hypothetical protein
VLAIVHIGHRERDAGDPGGGHRVTSMATAGE